MNKTPVERRAEVLGMCQAYAAAALTQNAYVINAVAVAIEQVDLPRLMPDRPTLAQVVAQQGEI